MGEGAIHNPGPSEGRRTRRLIGLLLLTLVVVGVGWAYQRISRDFPVVIADGENEIQLFTRRATVAEALAAAGIELLPEDAVEPELNAPLSPNLYIKIERAVPVEISADGTVHALRTRATTVAGALQDAGIALGEVDRVTPDLGQPVAAGMRITVVRVTEVFETETETLPFRIIPWADPTLPRGETRLHVEGQEGVLERTIRIVYEDGVEVLREVVDERTVVPVRDRIVYVGTLDRLPTVETPEGPRQYVEVRTMEVTAYEASPVSTGIWSDGYTKTGLVARRGVIATDPNVIPLGTELYVPGYGVGIAADVGGAIKGNKLDVFFETLEEALEWGRRTVDVYILAP